MGIFLFWRRRKWYRQILRILQALRLAAGMLDSRLRGNDGGRRIKTYRKSAPFRRKPESLLPVFSFPRSSVGMHTGGVFAALPKKTASRLIPSPPLRHSRAERKASSCRNLFRHEECRKEKHRARSDEIPAFAGMVRFFLFWRRRKWYRRILRILQALRLTVGMLDSRLRGNDGVGRIKIHRKSAPFPRKRESPLRILVPTLQRGNAYRRRLRRLTQKNRQPFNSISPSSSFPRRRESSMPD